MTRSYMTDFATCRPMGDWVVQAAEIACERLFADHMLACPHAGKDHLGVQRRRGADIDDLDVLVGEQLAIVAMRLRNAETLCEVDHPVAA